MKPLVCLLFPALLLVGCAGQPHITIENFEEQLLESIDDAEAPREVLLERFGEPHYKKTNADGTEAWVYNYLSEIGETKKAVLTFRGGELVYVQFEM